MQGSWNEEGDWDGGLIGCGVEGLELTHLVAFGEWFHRGEEPSSDKQVVTPPNKDNLQRYSEGSIRVTSSSLDLHISPSLLVNFLVTLLGSGKARITDVCSHRMIWEVERQVARQGGQPCLGMEGLGRLG